MTTVINHRANLSLAPTRRAEDETRGERENPRRIILPSPIPPSPSGQAAFVRGLLLLFLFLQPRPTNDGRCRDDGKGPAPRRARPSAFRVPDSKLVKLRFRSPESAPGEFHPRTISIPFSGIPRPSESTAAAVEPYREKGGGGGKKGEGGKGRPAR